MSTNIKPLEMPQLNYDRRARPVSGGQQPLSGIAAAKHSRDIQPAADQPIPDKLDGTPGNNKQSL